MGNKETTFYTGKIVIADTVVRGTTVKTSGWSVLGITLSPLSPAIRGDKGTSVTVINNTGYMASTSHDLQKISGRIKLKQVVSGVVSQVETDPTVPIFVKQITVQDIERWNEKDFDTLTNIELESMLK